MVEAGNKFVRLRTAGEYEMLSRKNQQSDAGERITRNSALQSDYSLFPTPYSLSSQAGVTLIELLVVVTIIALFAALVGPRLFKHVGKSRATAAHAQISSFQTAIGVYKLDTGTFPTTEQGLQALRVRPGNVERWDGPYLPQDIPLDPWGRPYIYRFSGEHGDEPDIIAYGADGRAGGDGEDADILRWTSRSQ